MENTIKKQLANFKQNSGLTWDAISDGVGINKFTLIRIATIKGRKPLQAHEKMIKKYLKKMLTHVN